MDLGEIMSYVGVAIGSGGLTQFFNWRANKKRSLAEAKNAEAEADNAAAEAHNKEIENMRKAMEDFYTPLVTKQNERIAAQDNRIVELEAEVKQLRDEKRAEADAHAKQLAVLQQQIVEITKVLGIRAQTAIRDGNSTYHERKPKQK